MCFDDFSEATIVPFTSENVCVVSLTQALGAVVGTYVDRSLRPRQLVEYPYQFNKWDERVSCTTSGCNVGNGRYGPDYGEVIVTPPNPNFSCLGCYELDTFSNSKPGDWGCWAGSYTGEFTECQLNDICQTWVNVIETTQSNKESDYTYQVSRGCQGTLL